MMLLLISYTPLFLVKLMLNISFIFWLITVSRSNAVSVGVIYHASLIESDSNFTINGLNCDECLCQMFTSSMFSLNCFTNNSNGVICQMFSDEIYLGVNSSQVKINLNSIFYFRLSNQSEITTTQMMTSTPVTTSNDITTSSTTMTTTTTSSSTSTTTATTTPACSSSGHGTLSSLNMSTPVSWTQYSYNYTASSTTLTLVFAFMTEPARTYYLDDISVVDVNASNIQLLENPSFENSTANLNGWTLWCSTSCGATGGQLYTTNKCHLSIGICFGVNCPGAGAIIFLGQSFSTVIGHIYTISYWLIASGGGGGANIKNHFYVDVN